MDSVNQTVAAAMKSNDPDIRIKAEAFRAWQEAGRELAKAEAALAAEKSRFAERQTDMENNIKAQIAHAAPIIGRERKAIAASEALIAQYEARVDAARAVLDKEAKEYDATIEGLRQMVGAARAVVARVELK